jgi:SAM-dependent methyltransferase
MPDGEEGNRVQAAYWEERSSSWIEAEEFTGQVAAPFGLRTMDRLTLEPGQTVLDVGCGTGATTVELAQRVSPGGAVVGVDIAPSMLTAARAHAARQRAEAVEFVVGDAQTDDLGADRFDAVYSRFGVMFFADPPAAFSNLRRALRAGGRLAFVCWQDLFVNEWMLVPGAAAVGLTGEPPPMPGPDEPGPFSLADRGRIERLLADAGFTAIDVVPHSEDVVVAADELDRVVDAATRVGAVRAVLVAHDDEHGFRAEVRAAVLAALQERVRDGEVRLGAAALIVTAARE